MGGVSGELMPGLDTAGTLLHGNDWLLENGSSIYDDGEIRVSVHIEARFVYEACSRRTVITSSAASGSVADSGTVTVAIKGPHLGGPNPFVQTRRPIAARSCRADRTDEWRRYGNPPSRGAMPPAIHR